MEQKELAARIDHTLLKPETTIEQVEKLCKEAIENGFAAVCIPPWYVSLATGFLKGGSAKLATVIGFPLGYSHSLIKVEEAKRAMEDGAEELDVVMNLAAFFSGKEKDVLKEIQSITQLAHLKGKKVKWIVETCLLNPEQLRKVCHLAVKAEVDFVKTSTGFNGPGATAETIRALREALPARIRIKASGGIKTTEQAFALLEAGADRLGTSASMQIAGSFIVPV